MPGRARPWPLRYVALCYFHIRSGAGFGFNPLAIIAPTRRKEDADAPNDRMPIIFPFAPM